MEQDKTKQSEIMRAHISACRANKMKVSKYCTQHQLKTSNFYYWEKKLSPQQAGNFIHVTPIISDAPVSIVFINGKRLSFEALPPVDYVLQLMI